MTDRPSIAQRLAALTENQMLDAVNDALALRRNAAPDTARPIERRSGTTGDNPTQRRPAWGEW